MNLSRALKFMRKYVWLPDPQEGMLVDFIRQARWGEGPRLVVYGPVGTGKTRIATCLRALLPDLVLLEGAVLKGMNLGSLAQAVQHVKPVLIIAGSRQQAETARGFIPALFLPIVWCKKLEEAGVALNATPDEILRAGRSVWKSEEGSGTETA